MNPIPVPRSLCSERAWFGFVCLLRTALIVCLLASVTSIHGEESDTRETFRTRGAFQDQFTPLLNERTKMLKTWRLNLVLAATLSARLLPSRRALVQARTITIT